VAGIVISVGGRTGVNQKNFPHLLSLAMIPLNYDLTFTLKWINTVIILL